MITPRRDHLTPEQIAAYASNDLGVDEERLFEEHIDSCDTCRHSAESFMLGELQFPIDEWAKRKAAFVARLKHDIDTVVAAATVILSDAENRTARADVIPSSAGDRATQSRTDTVLSTPWFSTGPGTLSLRDPFELRVRAGAALEVVRGPAPQQMASALQQGRRAAVLGRPEPRTQSWLLEDHEAGLSVTLTATLAERVGKLFSVSVALMSVDGSSPTSADATYEVLDKGNIGPGGKAPVEKSGRLSELHGNPVHLKGGEWLVRISLRDKTRVWEIPIRATEE